MMKTNRSYLNTDEPVNMRFDVDSRSGLRAESRSCYDPSTGAPKNNAPQKPRTYKTEKELLAKLNTVSAYPNPAIDYTTIAYQLLYARENTALRIFDGTGKLVDEHKLGQNYEGQQLIDTRKYANGIYIFEVIQDGKQISADKFVISR